MMPCFVPLPESDERPQSYFPQQELHRNEQPSSTYICPTLSSSWRFRRFTILFSASHAAQIFLPFCLLVLSNNIHDNLSGLIELPQPIPERLFTLVLLEEGISLTQTVVLPNNTSEQRGDARMVRKHQPRDARGSMCSIWWL